MKRYLIFLILVVSLPRLKASNEVKKQFMADLNSCLKSMAESNFLIEINYNLYNNNLEGKAVETTKCKLGKYQNNIFTENQKMISYSNSKYQANIYTNDKIVVLNKSIIKRKLKMDQLLMTDSNMWSNYSDVILLSDSLNIRTYKVQFLPTSPLLAFQISIDIEKKMITKNIIFYNPKYADYLTRSAYKKNVKSNNKPIIVLDFLNRKSLTKEDESLFYCSNIQIEKKGAVKLLNNLSTFKKYNYLKK